MGEQAEVAGNPLPLPLKIRFNSAIFETCHL